MSATKREFWDEIEALPDSVEPNGYDWWAQQDQDQEWIREQEEDNV